MADRDTISSRRKKFIKHSFNEFYHSTELTKLLDTPSDDEGFINSVHVSDAIIGVVSDISSDPNEAEFLIDYLTGIDVDKLRRAYPEYAPKSGSNTWSVPLAAGRVAVAALRQMDIPTTSEREKYKLNNERPQVSEDLRNTIVSLYEGGLLTSEMAQGILLLFEQDVSTASFTAQRSARNRTRNTLKNEIAQTQAFTEQTMSEHATKSLSILNLVLKVAIAADEGVSYRSMSEVKEMYVRENPQFTPDQIEERVDEYIAYGLKLVYARKS